MANTSFKRSASFLLLRNVIVTFPKFGPNGKCVTHKLTQFRQNIFYGNYFLLLMTKKAIIYRAYFNFDNNNVIPSLQFI